MENKIDCFFIVFGKKLAEDFSNVKTLSSFIIPSIGDEIVLKGELLRVTRKIINYTQIQNYDIDQEGRGGELIYIFVDII